MRKNDSKSSKRIYVETWWGENVPDYMGMLAEVRVVKPDDWRVSVSQEVLDWSERRFREGSKILLYRFPVINLGDLGMIGNILRDKLRNRGIDVECRVYGNGMIDAILRRRGLPIKKKEIKDKWSVYRNNE